MAYFTKDFLDFFIELAANNNKDWFDNNRKRYIKSVKDPFNVFVKHMIGKMAQEDKSIAQLEPKDCIFRINRDIRFSDDKTPYKLMVSALITPGGKKHKGESASGFYFELGPEHVRVYGGIYMTDKDDLYAIREGIAKNLSKFRKLYMDPEFVKVYGEIHGEKNKVLPKEFREAAENEPLMFNKQWYFYADFEPEAVLRDDLDELIMNCHHAGKPLKEFLNKQKNR